MSTSSKVFIVDDSVLIRYALTQLLNKEEGVVVVGDAAASDSLVSEIRKAGPDILLMDIPVPREKGIAALKSIKSLRLPVIVFTRSDSHIARDLIPLLDAGAVGFVLKPEKDQDVVLVKDSIVHELSINRPQRTPTTKAGEVKNKPTLMSPLQVVAIGSSTGGPEALSAIIGQFPADFPAGIVIVQHMPADFTTRFAHRLNALTPLTVKEAKEGDIVQPGVVLLAPGDYHMRFYEYIDGNRRYAKVRLSQDPPQWKLRPTVDNMMITLGPLYGRNIVGVILTGMGEDGVVGMRVIKNHGGRTVVQNKATSVVFGMGQEVIKNNLADEVLPLKSIVPRIVEMIGGAR